MVANGVVSGFVEEQWLDHMVHILRLRLVMFISQIFFKLATKKAKGFWFFYFCDYTLAKTKQKNKNRKAKKSTLIEFFSYFKQKKLKKKVKKN